MSNSYKKNPLPGQFNHQPELILSAAVGIGPERRNWFLEHLHKIAPDKDKQRELLQAWWLALVQLDDEKLPPEGATSIL